jgi:D-glycero-alpha-D-manno-heptose-7-phosphate kinase
MIVIRSPFRIPLGGGGTDLPSYYKKFNGFLITASINKYMFISINQPAIVNKIKINYSITEIIDLDKIDELKHEIVRETLKFLKIKSPLEISSMADLSAGTGMGSSSSYTVALLRGLNLMLRRYIPIQELAEEACHIEIDLIGKPIGKQDQYAAAFGGIIELKINQSGVVEVAPLNLENELINELENRLMMFYTNIERNANDILSEQTKKISIDENVALNAMHKIKEIGLEVKESLVNGDIDMFGKLMHEHWLTKRSISEQMSNSKIDEWYTLALKNGAIGGKIMGAGGGGFLLLCSENGKRKSLRKAMEEAGMKYMDFKFDWEGCKALVNI